MTTSPNNHNHQQLHRSFSTNRCRRWRRCHITTAVVAVLALLFSTAAWLSLVFSGTTSRCWHRYARRRVATPLSPPPPPPPPPSLLIPPDMINNNAGLQLNHIVFGIAGSSQLWKRRKEFIRLWWRPRHMRGHVWLDDHVTPDDHTADADADADLPPTIVSEDISTFRYTNPTGHPSGIRISRIISESFRLRLPNVRWFVLGDDDTIFNPDNLLALLSKYDSSQMLYIGSPSESHSANSYFSHSMAFGGGGIAISYPLAEALSRIQDDCLDRYPKLYGSDDRLHACISELGVPLTREPGFHQWDIRGNAHGLLAAHPIAPFVSIHHVEAVDPIYPGLKSLEALKLFTKAMTTNPRSFLQRSMCYDHTHRLTISVSLGYVVQVFPNIVLPRELERSEQTYSAWNGISQRMEFDFDTRDAYRSVCKKPIQFFLKDVWKDGNNTIGTYSRAKRRDDFKRKVFCFPRQPPLPHVQTIHVVAYPLTEKWLLVPRRLCCNMNRTNEQLQLTVGQCESGAFSSGGLPIWYLVFHGHALLICLAIKLRMAGGALVLGFQLTSKHADCRHQAWESYSLPSLFP
ncbi:hypothetical protein Sjap_005860 [Stephania japonica]|uniref:Uncharacterized protein n=1 Tax=Stephania japonica TaxID=461633 RepID=A0AAP0PJ73_9MAGN